MLKASSATSNTDIGKSRSGKIIVALQMALCVVLLVGGALLVRTFRNLKNIPLGMRTDGLVVFGVNPQNLHSRAEGLAFYEELIRRLRVLPGVDSVTIMESRLGSWWSNNRQAIVDGKPPVVAGGGSSLTRSNVVGPDFFHAIGVPVLAGRDFSDSDTTNSPHVAVVNELFAERFLANQNPLGHHVMGDDGKTDMVIVGVVKNHKYRSMDEDPIPMSWSAYTQNGDVGEMHVEMRVHGDPLAISAVRAKSSAADGPQPASAATNDPTRAIRNDHLPAICCSPGWPGSLVHWRYCWLPPVSMGLLLTA